MSSGQTGTGQGNRTSRQTNASAAPNPQRASRQAAAKQVSTPSNSSTSTNTRNASASQGGAQSTGARKLRYKPKDVEAHREHRQTYLKLVKMLETRKPEDKPRVFVFTDVEQDYDDLLAVIFLAEMHRMGVVELVGFVANHQPAAKRARFLRTVLHLVGLGHIPVAVGTSGVEDAKSHGADLFYGLKNTTFDQAPWNNEPFVTGAELIPQVLRSKPNVTALMLSTLQDIGEFFDKQDKTADFKANNFSKFVSQGGYEVKVQQAPQSGDLRQKGKIAPRGNSPPQVKVSLTPVKDMANNKFHPSQAANYTNHIAAHKLPSDAWSREAAKAARLPGTFMKQLFKYGPIGAHLEWLWMRQEFKFYWDPFNWPFMDFLNTDWYLNTRLGYGKESKEFKALQGTDLSFADAAPKIKVIAYDGCAAVGAVGDDFMRAMGILGHEGHLPDYNRPAVSGHPHRVFGREADKPGELNPEKLGGINPSQLASTIKTFLLGSLMATAAKAEEKIPRASIRHKTVPATVDVAVFKDKILLQRNAKIMDELKEKLADAKAKKDQTKAGDYETALRTRREMTREAEARVKAAEGGKIVMPTRAQVPYEQLYEEAMRASKNQARVKVKGGLAAVTAVAAVAAGVTKTK
ncbi:predicted protein [Chaetomium globosum CBS 148.51]|uniref:Inosine/uridine-preferring nucleoside hydrolase domain-containing protein n=1 Tax=Chaetomium globosum (strain ATCC 6205 / CBS 148.51 / DSM 1962 / NBRC 6347 / NRRL 1970) TaxID=306901 RepID=Q2H5L9_CHAGB|nr:uncharacterized protein CHGG_06046 [Chaetomium globosum CBS 148.51]EAQ89427.1 predicted protein [Chaetomium globosum CBS 148.51]